MSPKKKKKPTKPKPIDLKLTLENFGPLRKAEIDLKPMTIFIGPNNSGKTYAAMMFYSLFDSMGPNTTFYFGNQRPDARSLFVNQRYEQLADPFLPQPYEEIVINHFAEILHPENGDALSMPHELTLEVARAFISETFMDYLINSLMRCFDSELKDLARNGTDTNKLRIQFETPEIQAGFVFTKEEMHVQKLTIDPITISRRAFLRKLNESREDEMFPFETADDNAAAFISESVAVRINDILLRCLGISCRYLPAPRSAILSHYKAVLGGLIRPQSYSSRLQPEIPGVTGITSDLMHVLMNLPRRYGCFAELESRVSAEVILGRIASDKHSVELLPDFMYESNAPDLPLHRASSSVAELAPFFLFLRYLIAPGDVLIIDEPEAHLHPGAIRILAKYLVRLVRERVNLIITTHSDYLLEQLNHFILLSKVDPKRRKEKYQDYEVDDFLKPEEVGAYVFNYDEKEEGYVTQELVIDEEEGLIEEEFNKVNEALYDELASLRRDVAKQSKK